MRVVLQRVKRGSVTVFESGDANGRVTGRIGPGLVLLVGFKAGDTEDAVLRLAKKTVELRIFEDDEGKMNRSIQDIDGAILVVSQFTLYGNTHKGRRPSFAGTMPPADAEAMYRRFIQLLENSGLPIAAGVFGAKMEVEIVNDGPVTFILNDDVSLP